MTLYAEIGGVQVLEGRIVIPKLGAWYADVQLSAEAPLTGNLTLVVGALRVACVKWRGGPYQGRTVARLIGGKGGLQRQLPAKAYRNAAGVKLSLVLADVARETGETISVAEDRALGVHSVRDVGPAQRSLNRYARRWHVTPSSGVIVVGPWETDAKHKPIAAPFELVHYDPSLGVATIAAEALEEFTPERTLTSPQLPGTTLEVNAVVHLVGPKEIRTQILCSEVRP